MSKKTGELDRGVVLTLVVVLLLVVGYFVTTWAPDSSEVPEVVETVEVPEERTLGSLLSLMLETERQIWDAEFLIDAQQSGFRAAMAMMMHEGAGITVERAMQSVFIEVPASWWDELESCWRGGRCPPSGASFPPPLLASPPPVLASFATAEMNLSAEQILKLGLPSGTIWGGWNQPSSI